MDPTQSTIQPPPQTPPVNIPDFQPKPNYLKTILFSILGVLLVSSITYLYLQNQKLQQQVLNSPVSPTIQSPSPTSKPSTSISIPSDEEWKTYTNTKHGFTIKYPINWKIQEGNNTPNVVSLLSPETQKIMEANSKLEGQVYIPKDYILIFTDIAINVYPINEASNIFDGYFQDPPVGDDPSQIISDVTIGNINYKMTTMPADRPYLAYLTIHNDAYYMIDFLNIKSINELSTLERQILSTFKFIDNQSVCVPAYQVETNTSELTAKQNYSTRCTEQRLEKDCLSIDLYNQKADDFSISDGIPDCIWKNPTK